MRLLSTRSVDELSIETLAEEAGISRGLLYHYFGHKRDFHRAVVRKAADDLIAVTAPPPDGEPLDRVTASVEAYVDHVVANYEGYASLVRGAASGNADLRRIYDEVRTVLTDRIIDAAGGGHEPGPAGGLSLEDTRATRLLVRGWSAMTEDVVLTWVRDPGDVAKGDLRRMLSAALPGMLGGLPNR